MKRFSEWNNKKITINEKKAIFFKTREIFYAHIGENVGYEQDGKGDDFVRPVLIFQKFNNSVFWGIPLTSTLRDGKFYYHFSFIKDVTSVAILSQLKMFDAKRLDRKIGKINKEAFEELKTKGIGLMSSEE